MAPKMEPKCSQNGSQIRSEAVLEGPRSLPKNRLKNESKILDFGEALGTPSGHLFGNILEPVWRLFADPVLRGVLEAFWEGFGVDFGVDFGRILGLFWNIC